MGARPRAVLLAAVLAVAGLTACGADDGASGPTLDGAPTGTPSNAAQAGEAEPGTYLALGDSIPFGYVSGFAQGYADEDAFVGYPQLIGWDRGLTVVDATCPGETTASLIDEAAPDNGCNNVRGTGQGYRDLYPLHVDYGGSQLEHAVQVLRSGDDVELVTLQIGVNDAFICNDTGGCDDLAGLAAMAERVRGNLDTILTALRERGGYDGRIVVVSYYTADYDNELGSFGTEMLNSGILAAARAHGVDVADGFAAFRPVAAADGGGSSVAAGLLTADQVHPTPRGQRLLADAVEDVLDS